MNLSREEELRIFRKVCGKNRVTEKQHRNRLEGNSIRSGIYNQGISMAKLKEYIKEGGKYNVFN